MMWTTQPRSERGGLAAITRGTGPSVLLLHGVGLRAEAWSAQFELPAKITAPDMSGHGESPWPGQALSFEDFVQAALAVLKDMEGPVIIVGHSMGAMLALELTNRAPGSVSAVVALNAIFERSPDAEEKVKSRAAELDGATIPDPTPTLERWFGAEMSAERDACERWLRGVDPAAYKSAYTAFATSRIPDQEGLARLQCPALFVT
ncbi:MAG: alpha/beta hydrolase, partial [Pseudomonadota bacterium]